MADPKSDWDDFNWFVTDYIPRQTIPILRRFASHVEARTRLNVGIRAGDKKADIVDKIVGAFRALKAKNDLANYTHIRGLCENEGNFVGRPTATPTYGPPPTFGGVANGMNGTQRYAGYAAPAASSSYRPAAPAAAAGPSRNGWASQNTTTAYAAGRQFVLQDWKPNPMWKPIKALTNMDMLPDIGPSEPSSTRRERKSHISFTPDIIEKLNQSKANPNQHPQYSIRIFCTSNDFYKPPNTPYSPANALINNQQMPIDYPTNPDVYVDDYPIPFKERGLRGKPGSAPPFDLDRGSRGLAKHPGRMVSVNMGHTGPSVGKKKEVSKKFFYQVVYCEITTSAELQKRIDDMKPANAQDSLGLLRKKQDDDDDIVFGQSRMSLKDPLSYMRLVRPIRSTKCSHLQCFEAKWWIVGNEKHPQWLCPLCNRALRFDELIVDGFSLDILDIVPEKYDEVVIEADNAWHTEDGQYGSASWLRLNNTSARATREPTPKKDEEEDTKPDQFRLSTSPDPKGKRKAIEILSSDDEDYERPLAKIGTSTNTNLRPPTLPNLTVRPPSHSGAPPTSRPASAQPQPPANSSGVIDLTLSDSDDDDVEDAVTNFNRSNDRSGSGPSTYLGPPPLQPPPSSQARGGPSTARSPSVTSRTNNNTTNGHASGTNGASVNDASAAPGPGHDYTTNGLRPQSTSTSASASTSTQAQPGYRYVPPYMANPHDTFSYNPNSRPHKQASNDRYRPGSASATTATANNGSGSATGSGNENASTTGPQPVDSWRRASQLDELRRKRTQQAERDRGMETDSEDDDYRYHGR